MTALTIYVAGPMTGIPDRNYPAFHAAEEQLTARGFKVLSPTQHGEPEGVHPWHYYMRLGLRMLLDADAVALLPGWSRSRGANLEAVVAEALEMPVKGLADWLNDD